jgi:hypothetical protein
MRGSPRFPYVGSRGTAMRDHHGEVVEVVAMSKKSFADLANLEQARRGAESFALCSLPLDLPDFLRRGEL